MDLGGFEFEAIAQPLLEEDLGVGVVLADCAHEDVHIRPVAGVCGELGLRLDTEFPEIVAGGAAFLLRTGDSSGMGLQIGLEAGELVFEILRIPLECEGLGVVRGWGGFRILDIADCFTDDNPFEEVLGRVPRVHRTGRITLDFGGAAIGKPSGLEFGLEALGLREPEAARRLLDFLLHPGNLCGGAFLGLFGGSGGRRWGGEGFDDLIDRLRLNGSAQQGHESDMQKGRAE